MPNSFGNDLDEIWMRGEKKKLLMEADSSIAKRNRDSL